MSQFFTLKELTYSGTALLKKINNVPNEAVKVNLEILMEQLDKIRDKWGRPIYVNSGYRCPELNKAVGGVKTSQHQLGVAVDITTKDAKLDKQLYDMIVQNFDYDQCIWERSGSTVWIHYSYVRPNRKLKLSITK